MRQLAAFEKAKGELETVGCSVLAASVDTLEQAQKVISTARLTYTVAYGCTKDDAETIGAWWGNHPPDGGHMQPAEFLLGRSGVVIGSLYASGSVGRMGVDEVLRAITSRERARLQREQAQPQTRP